MPKALAGNPKGDVTIVAFLDYNCPYCRRSTPELARFLKSDPNVRVVFKDWPILSEASVTEAKIALAANYQGKYLAAHTALMAIKMRPATSPTIKGALDAAGIDIARLNKDLDTHNDAIAGLLRRDMAEADALGFKGAPVFVIGPFVMAQALDEAGFRQVVADARARRRPSADKKSEHHMPESMTRRRLLIGVSAAAVVSGSPLMLRAADKPVEVAGKRVTLLHFTDSHAQIETHLDYLPGAAPEFQMMGGFARLKTAIEAEKARCTGACFVLDGGDDFQGSGPAAWSKGKAILEPLNAMGIDAFTPGNWEATYGPDVFKATMAALDCPVVCYNLHDIATGERVYPASVILRRGDVRMAVVGITDIGASKRQPPDEWRGMDTERMEGLRDYVKDLRTREKPDLVIALTHTGLTIARNIAREIPELDVVLSGHSHERTAWPILEGNVIVVEAGAFSSWLGRLDLVLKPGGGVAAHEFELIPILASRYAEQPRVKDMVEASLAPHRARMKREVGKTDTILMRYDVLETSADNFVSDAVRAAAGTDIGFTNGFRFGVPVAVPTITEGDLWSLLPMEARMKKGWVTGKELRAYWEDELEMVYSTNPMKLNGGWGPRASGMDILFDARAGRGQRVVSIKVGGRDIEDDRHYSIAGCERAGEPIDVICRHRNSHDPEILPTSIHEALERYLADHATISPKPDGRESARDLPKVVFSQDAVLSDPHLRGAPTIPKGLPPEPHRFVPK